MHGVQYCTYVDTSLSVRWKIRSTHMGVASLSYPCTPCRTDKAYRNQFTRPQPNASTNCVLGVYTWPNVEYTISTRTHICTIRWNNQCFRCNPVKFSARSRRTSYPAESTTMALSARLPPIGPLPPIQVWQSRRCNLDMASLTDSSTDGKKISHFRGRELHGKALKVPEGYRGVVVEKKEAPAPEARRLDQPEEVIDLEAEEEAVPLGALEAQAEFDELVIWGHEAMADAASDPYARGVEEWMQLSAQVRWNAAGRLTSHEYADIWFRYMHMTPEQRRLSEASSVLCMGIEYVDVITVEGVMRGKKKGCRSLQHLNDSEIRCTLDRRKCRPGPRIWKHDANPSACSHN